jgi:hypothetical protein
MSDGDRELHEQVRELTAEVKRLRYSVVIALIALGAMILLAAWDAQGFLQIVMTGMFVLATVALLSAVIDGLRKVLPRRSR